ncbi:MAG: hypothetical protein ABH883_06235 [Candidatus Omnitrophota bacterium]
MNIKKTVFAIVYAVFILLIFEAWARGYYAAGRGLSFFSRPDDQVYLWYPQLKQLENYKYDSDKYNVLLLGGSVLTEDWGEVPAYLGGVIEGASGKKANIVNLAAAAHSSLDSYYKYLWVRDRKFDSVFFYHGINEARANNVPPDIWKDDYSHYSWYSEVNFFFRHPWLRKAGLLLPYFFKHLMVQIDREVLNRHGYVPEHSPRPEWVAYGVDVKTKNSFKNNLKHIVDLAESKGEPLTVMTFAYYREEGSGSAEGEQAPDKKFTEIWGNEENVIKGMDAHNDVIRELAASGSFIFLDQKSKMGNGREFFKDICHFTPEGSRVFASNMSGAVKLSKK